MILHPGFIENIDQSEFTLYSDTDSSYSKIPLPFSKFSDQHKVIDYVQDMARKFNEEFLNVFNETVVKYGNVDPEYNLMDFKSEVVAYRGFFNSKKYYGLAKMWDEGTYFDNPKIKKTGGQIVKADTTPITVDLLQEIYNLLLLNFEITSEVEMYRYIFIHLRDKYRQRTTTAVEQLNFKEFGIPKKWGLKELKTIPKQVKGAMLYNYLFNDVLRSGESMLQCQILINPSKLLQYTHTHKPNSKYQIKQEMVTNKFNVISFPVDMTESEIKSVEPRFRELDIQFDLRTILDFNVELKIEQFKKLFTEETRRSAI